MSTKSTEQAGMELLALASKYGLPKVCYVEKKNFVAVANVFCQSKVSVALPITLFSYLHGNNFACFTECKFALKWAALFD